MIGPCNHRCSIYVVWALMPRGMGAMTPFSLLQQASLRGFSSCFANCRSLNRVVDCGTSGG
jgi:hypothetical protein